MSEPDIRTVVGSLVGVPSSTDAITDAMVAANPDLDEEVLRAAIGPAIDVLYAARDKGLVMHHAGAACAVVALKVVHEMRRLT
jgi:hypothetical protein